MCSKNCFRWTLAILLMLGLQWPAYAGITLSGTRVILGEKDREASIPVKNTSTSPYVVQTWIDAGEGNNKTPLLVTPPLSRLDPGRENILRIMRVAGDLPADRESVFWLNVKEIPERSKDENVLQIAVRSRIKLFYRPTRLAGKQEDSRAQLQWVVSPESEGRGAVLRVANPSAYHVTFTALNINDGQQTINADTRGVTQRAVLEALGRDGLKLHPAKFKKLLEEARAQRNENGEGLRCSSCGGVQMTPPATEAQLEEGSEK